MAGTLFHLPKATPIDNGVTVPGGKLTFTQSGTTTPQNVYQDLDLSTAHSNPVVADAEGVFAPIYLDPSLPAYRVKLTDASDTLIYQVDDVPSGLKTAADEFTITGDAPYIDIIEDDASTDSGGYRLQATGDQLILYLLNDALSVQTAVAKWTRTGTTGDLLELLTTDTYTEAGTFTGTLVGVSTTTTGTINYVRLGKLVHLWANATITGTSNTTGLTMSGLPESLQTTGTRRCYSPVINSGDEYQGQAVFTSGSGIILFRIAWCSSAPGGVFPATSNFTNSGDKGIPIGWSVTYHL